MKVGIFYNSIGNPRKFPNKTGLMDHFAQGVRANGDQAIDFWEQSLPNESLDAGFVLGYTLDKNFRRNLIDYLGQSRVPTVFVDSNILHYARSEHQWHRYSIDSVYPDSGRYFFGDLDPVKWLAFGGYHSVTLRPWRQTGNHILVLAQRPHGWNMQGADQSTWLDSVIQDIQKYTDRPIRIRMHPGDKHRHQQIQQLMHRWGSAIEISRAENIRGDLKHCWSAVGYNSTPTAVSAIEGIPVYVQDPDRSWAKDVCYTDLSQIELPPCPDRACWITKIANIHWSNEEVQKGRLWSAIKRSIFSVPV